MLDFKVNLRVNKSKFDKLMEFFKASESETFSKFIRNCMDAKIRKEKL